MASEKLTIWCNAKFGADAQRLLESGLNSHRLLLSLVEQGIEPRQYYPELGWGQQELSISHHPALHAADAHVLYRETVRGVVRNHGLYSSFAPKPWPDQPGNGCRASARWGRAR